MRIRNITGIIAGVGASVLIAGSPVAKAEQAPTIGERVDALEKQVKEGVGALDKLGIEFHGLLSTTYNYNFNNPDNKTNGLHVFDVDANTFALDDAVINIQRNKPEGLSFNLDIDFGKTAEVVGGVTRWSNNPSNTESHNSVELRDATVKYAIPDSPFSITAGKFVTFHGAEVIKAYNNFNYNISNSILFGWAIPFTHLGVYGTYTFGDMGNIAAGVINGWDDPADNNDGKSLTTMLTLTPTSMFTINLPVTYGPEQQNSGRSKRFLVTPLFTVKPTDMLTFILEYDYGNESNVAYSNATGFVYGAVPGNADWQGAAVYGIVQATDSLQLVLRGEYFTDPDGVRTLFQESGYGPGADFWEITPTVAYKITDGLTFRAEYRHDESDKRYFNKDDPGLFIRGQDIVETELIYAF